MKIGSANALPPNQRKLSKYDFPLRRNHRRGFVQSGVVTIAIQTHDRMQPERPGTGSILPLNTLPLFNQIKSTSNNSVLSIIDQYRQAVYSHLKGYILEFWACLIGVPGTTFSLFMNLRAAAPGWQPWM